MSGAQSFPEICFASSQSGEIKSAIGNVSIGREHSTDELVKFKAEKKLTMPFAPDPKREVFAKYATKYIPRNVIIDSDGKVLFQSVGYDPAEFAGMVKTIDSKLPR